MVLKDSEAITWAEGKWGLVIKKRRTFADVSDQMASFIFSWAPRNVKEMASGKIIRQSKMLGILQVFKRGTSSVRCVLFFWKSWALKL